MLSFEEQEQEQEHNWVFSADQIELHIQMP